MEIGHDVEEAISLPLSITIIPCLSLDVTDDEAIDEENDDEDDTLCTLLGFAQALPPT